MSTGQVPLVSVLMPVYNTAPWLAQALQSVSSQLFRDFELVVIDDGSTDGSLEILHGYAAHEARMRVVSRANRGIVHTRNELLDLAQGRLVAWADSDDISLPLRLANQVEYFAKHGGLLCLGTAAQCVDPVGRFLNVERYPTTHEDILVEQRHGGAMRFPTTMMDRVAALQVGGFREPFRVGEDFDLLLRLSERGEMANLPEVHYLYRQHMANISRITSMDWPAYRDTILALAQERSSTGVDRLQRGEAVTITDTSRQYDRRLLEQGSYLTWARAALGNRDFGLAREYALAAIRRRPLQLAAWKTWCRALLRL